ncbi:MAG: DcaP family trimeric outer membrane transporter [Henriciella sp.]|nr:DcaP family trimeric outer membrane transporter [Henriciella sp.]
MFKGLKASLLIGSALTMSGAAYADISDIEERIAALEAMVEDLKAELAEERADVEEAIVRLDKVEQATPTDRVFATNTGFMVGDTTFKLAGFIDVDAHATTLSDGQIGSNSIARDFYIPGATPIGGDDTTFTDITAQASRFAVTAQKPVGENTVTGYLELDFLGSAQGNELVSSSFSPRLRRAYIDYKGWRVGQEWSTFQNTSAIPESASFLVLSDGMVFVRQAQIRYTRGNWQFAVENPNTTSLNIGSRDENLLPDVVARYNLKGDFGNVSFAAIGRQLRADLGTTEEETFGYGLSVAGRVNVGEKDDIRFNLTAGEGLGRYIGLAASRATALDPSGDLEAIPSYGGLIAWRHPFGETARFNLGYSGLFIDNPDYLGGGATSSVQSAYGAVLWDIAPKVTLGTELLFGQRELESGADGSITRFTFSTKYAF